MAASLSPYLICTTPRCGSTLLSELLTATGVAGRPQEFFEPLYATGRPRQPREYFESVRDPAVLELLPPTEPGHPESTEVWEQRLQDSFAGGSTPNGVWGATLKWGYLLDVLRRLGERDETAHLRPHDAVFELLPGVRLLHVRRQDKLAQAVSVWRELQAGEPVYSRAGIAHLLQQLILQERAWKVWFNTAGAQPHVVDYEDLVRDRRGTVLGVMHALGIDAAGVTIPEASLRQQSGRRSETWAERFDAERKVAA